VDEPRPAQESAYLYQGRATFVSKIADTWSEAELTGKSGDTATVCLLAEYNEIASAIVAREEVISPMCASNRAL
jgi:hypothetical protein